MTFLGYPIEIWLAATVAMLIRLQTSKTLTLLGATVTVIAALFAGIFLHEPVMQLFGLREDWTIPVAIILALSAENLMKAVVDLSADRNWLKDIIRHLIDRRVDRPSDYGHKNDYED